MSDTEENDIVTQEEAEDVETTSAEMPTIVISPVSRFTARALASTVADGGGGSEGHREGDGQVWSSTSPCRCAEHTCQVRWPAGLDSRSPRRRELPDSFPPSYVSNSDRELLVHAFVNNFDRQFRDLYRSRKPLLLLRPNECGVEVCQGWWRRRWWW
jgi:hypothetical protein